MGTINIQSTDLSHKAGLTYTGTSDKTIDVNSLVTKVSSTDNAIVRFDGTSGAVQNSSVVIDDSGNLGVGTTLTASSRMTIVGGALPTADNGNSYSLQFASGITGRRASGNTVGFIGTYANASSIEISAGQTGSGISMHGQAASANSNTVIVYTNDTERARFDNSGNMLVGTTSTSYAYAGASARWIGNGGGWLLSQGSTSGVNQVVFFNPNGQVGQINTSGSGTIYGTSSDYRLKEDYQDMVGATDRLKALKPINFAWKIDGSRVDGFLAHELQEVVPEAATGTKDAIREEEYIDENGDTQTREVPDYQGIDQSKLVPLLTKALQEAVERIEQLEARIEALEAK